MKYILLQEGDRIKNGDQYWSHTGGCWVIAQNIGGLIRGPLNDCMIYRRIIPTKPKVSLEELMGVVGQAMVIFDDTIASDDMSATVVRAICAHLGIEIEPEKEEWEVAIDELDEKLRHANVAAVASRDMFKFGFEAGQRSKEK